MLAPSGGGLGALSQLKLEHQRALVFRLQAVGLGARSQLKLEHQRALVFRLQAEVIAERCGYAILLGSRADKAWTTALYFLLTMLLATV
jgi:hypothetical protein